MYTDDRFEVDPKKMEEEEKAIWNSFNAVLGSGEKPADERK